MHIEGLAHSILTHGHIQQFKNIKITTGKVMIKIQNSFN